MTNDSTVWKSIDGIVGFALNGLPIFFGISADNTDPYYPRQWPNAVNTVPEVVDACVGHPQGDALYHYHMLPPCLVNAKQMNTTAVC